MKVKDKRIKKRIMERIEKLFTNHLDFLVFRKIPLSKNTTIVKSDEYIVIAYEGRLKNNSSWRDDDYITYYKVVLIGVNDDNKLFANYLDPRLYQGVAFYGRSWDEWIKEVKRFLGYDVDYNPDQYIYLRYVDDPRVYMNPLRVRVQGDICFEIRIRKIDDVKHGYIANLKETLTAHLVRTMIRELADKILKYLSDMRLGVSDVRVNDWSIRFTILTTKLNWDDKENIKRGLKRYIKDIIYDVTNIWREKFEYLVLRKEGLFESDSISVGYEDLFGVNETSINVDVFIDFERCFDKMKVEVERRYKDLFDSLFDELDYVDYEYQIGNHIIRCRSLPHNVSVRFYNFITERDDEVTINVDRDVLYVNSNVSLEHDEHGFTKVKLLCDEGYVYIIRVYETNIGNRDRLIRNKIILKRLIPK